MAAPHTRPTRERDRGTLKVGFIASSSAARAARPGWATGTVRRPPQRAVAVMCR